jgi:hypothetical protein
MSRLVRAVNWLSRVPGICPFISVLLHVATMITTRPCLLQVTPLQFAEPDAGHGFVFGSHVNACDQLGKDARAFMAVRSVPVTWALAGGAMRQRPPNSNTAARRRRTSEDFMVLLGKGEKPALGRSGKPETRVLVLNRAI